MSRTSQKAAVQCLLVRPIPPGILAMAKHTRSWDGKAIEIEDKGIAYTLVPSDNEVYIHRLHSEEDVASVLWKSIPRDEADMYEVWGNVQQYADLLDKFGM